VGVTTGNAQGGGCLIFHYGAPPTLPARRKPVNRAYWVFRQAPGRYAVGGTQGVDAH
jgi:hypothetical protein